MKKNKVKKLIAKMLGEEMFRIDIRIHDVEVASGLKEAIIDPIGQKEYLEHISIKDAEHLKPKTEPKMMHPELPVKWCVRVTKSNVKILEEWRDQGENSLSYKPIGGFLHHDKIWSPIICDSEEISFSDFERLVLKKPKELEVGKWYKNTTMNILAYHSAKMSGYGFRNTEWSNSICISHFPNWQEATKEEVESALTAEAKRQGFVVGVRFKSVLNGDIGVLSNEEFEYDPKNNTLQADCYPGGVFNNGVWAEIISQPEENIQEVDFEIDWSVPGQLVISETEGIILMTTGVHSAKKECFEAVTVATYSSVTKKGELWSKWSKEPFKLLQEPLTLRN